VIGNYTAVTYFTTTRKGPELAVIVPTYNERGNVALLVERVRQVLANLDFEIIFVDDDSPDGTHTAVKDIAKDDMRVRCLRRVGRRGLAGACIEGVLASSAPYVAIMDGDLQHDETLLPKMLNALRGGTELAVGSRYVPGTEAGNGLNRVRQWGSDVATSLARRALGINLSDPMSGFFMVRREKVEAVAGSLSREGFKILLDLVASSKVPLKTVEIPFLFKTRNSGVSKLDSAVTVQFLGLLVSKLTGGMVPLRFLMFAFVGATGLIVHLAALHTLNARFELAFGWSQLAATMIAMTFNFIVNNSFTYRDKRLKGVSFVIGLLTFYIVCSFGTLANVSVANLIHDYDASIPLLAGLAGAIMSSVFNYAATNALTWRNV
jgi:dolichol-phosphate mannosyltransferase